MKWVTRERPKTDRIACPWLIKNFIDPEAEFLYVPTEQVLEVAERERAHSYDAPGAKYTHRDGLCSFEVLLEEYELGEPALKLLARIVPGVAGVLIDEQQDLLFSSDRRAARVSVFRCSDEQLLGQVDVGPHPNGLAYDRRRRRLYSFNLGEPLGENCTASVVELDSMRVLAELQLPGRPRWAVYDNDRDCIYANIQRPAQV